MAKEEGVRTLVYGGRVDTPQQYCGVVGGQSTDFSTIDSEIKASVSCAIPGTSQLTLRLKSVKLKNHTLAPPDLYVLPSGEGDDALTLSQPHEQYSRYNMAARLWHRRPQAA